jgi:hypothetical protein
MGEHGLGAEVESCREERVTDRRGDLRRLVRLGLCIVAEAVESDSVGVDERRGRPNRRKTRT